MVLANATVMCEDFVLRRCDIEITNGRISNIGTGLTGAPRIDKTGKYILPGFIDTHIHGAYGSRISDPTPDMDKITAFDAASTGCPIATAVIDRYTGYAAAGITSIMRVFQPEAVILGGAISEQGDNLLRPIRDKCILPVDIKISELKNNAGLLGAAALAKEKG